MPHEIRARRIAGLPTSAPRQTFRWRLLALPVLVAALLMLGLAPCPAAPTNDAFANAIAATPVPYTTTQSDIGTATTVAGDPTPTCRTGGAQAPTQSVWYTVTGTGGVLVIDTLGSGYDTLLAV